MQKTCQNCGTKFSITDKDLAFYDKISPVFAGKKYGIPTPTQCPDCRQQRRFALRNERNFYIRKSDKSGENMVSAYSPDKEMIVRKAEERRSDDYDGTKYGKEFDYTKGFFEQYNDLSINTPRPCLMNMKSENSEYTNHAVYNKNCYMCMDCGYNEDLLYCSHFCIYNKKCVDGLYIQYCENCYNCTDCIKCISSSYLFECNECYQSHFCYDCVGCNNCFACYNLRNKNYCIYNKQYTKEEYENKMGEIMPKNLEEYNKAIEQRKENMKNTSIHKNLDIENSDNVSGNKIKNCENVQDSYLIFDSKDCKFCYDAGEMKDCYDVAEPFKGELEYEIHASNINYNILFVSKCFENKNLIYCQYCWFCESCFGCFGLHNKKYCVFNKQYSKEEYENLVAKIIEKMRDDGERGEFFPVDISGFAYNETLSNEYYPMNKEEVIKKGWKRKDNNNDSKPNSSNDPNIIICETSGRAFRLIPYELEFYKKYSIPYPTKHPDIRHQDRMKLRTPRKLRSTYCDNCSKDIQTTYPIGIENIYCEDCYNNEIY